MMKNFNGRNKFMIKFIRITFIMEFNFSDEEHKQIRCKQLLEYVMD